MSGYSDNYRKAQSVLGIDAVLKEQLRVIGAKSWTKMNIIERGKLINALRKLWAKSNKGQV
jgi:hypothetical protein